MLTPYAAYLRVYEPLETFPEPARSTWTELVSSNSLPDQAAGVVEERQRSLTNLLATPPVAVPARDGDEAYVVMVDGSPYVCPWDTRLRCWTALEDFRRGVSHPVADAFVPRVVIEQALADYELWRSDNPDVQPHILTSTWHVPLRWFVPFGQDERIVQKGNGGRTLFYRTPMVQARRRVARSLQVLRHTVEDGPLTSGVEDLGRWLEEFHPRSYVELDYGGLVRVISDEALESDQSAADVAAGLEALSDGDAVRAAQAYHRLMERWRVVQALERAS